MLPIMHIPVSYANQLAATMILGQLHIFQVPLQHKTKVGVQLKKKPKQYSKAYKGSTTTLEVQNVPLDATISC